MDEINDDFPVVGTEEQEQEEEAYYRFEDQDLRILKALVTNKLTAIKFTNSYDHEIFFGDAKAVGETIIEYVKAYKSIPTRRVLLDLHKKDQELHNKIDHAWELLSEIDHNESEFEYDLEKLKNRFTKVKLVNVRDAVNDLDFSDIDYEKEIKSIQRKIDEATGIRKGSKQAYIQKTLKAYMPEYKRNFRAKVSDKSLGRGIPTGYSYLDYVKNGLSPAEMLIIAGETGGGKSMMLNNMAIQMWLQGNTPKTPKDQLIKGCNVLYFSLEMPYDGCARRTLARVADLPTYSLRDCSLNKEQAKRLGDTVDFINEYPFEFEIVDIPRGVTIEQIELRFNEALTKYSPEVVVVDYLGLMDASGSDNSDQDWLRLGHIAGRLHEFARAYNIIMLTAVQLNRPQNKSAKNSSELIGMHRIGRSSLIMHHANLAIQIESRKDEAIMDDLVYHIIKNRDGELGSHRMRKKFQNNLILFH